MTDSIFVTNAQLVRLYGVVRSTICDWVTAGMPKTARGRYDLYAVHSWWIENINADPADAGTDDARGRYWNAKAESEEIKTLQLKESLISRSEVIQEWTWRCSDLRTGLLSWASRLPPALEGKGAIELMLVLRGAVDDLLDSFCRNGRFTPKPEPKPAKKPKRQKPVS
ncbi:MAG: hypothetical protein WA705_14065 [Candidatus Ozemobacteraceae bacterium]